MTKPSFWQRLNLARQVFRKGLPRPRGRKSVPYVWPSWRRGKPKWQLTDYVSYADEGFQQNDLLYRAVMYKVRAKRTAPLRAYTSSRDSPELAPPEHPLAQLVDRPNPHQSMTELEDLATVYFNIAGQYYIQLIREKPNDIPVSMYLLRPDRVYVVPDPRSAEGEQLLGYWYVPENCALADGRAIRYQDMMHVKNPNPLDPLEGLGDGFSPVSPGARSTDVDNAITSFLKKFFDSGLMPNVVLSTEHPIDDTIADEVRDQWREIYGGYDAWLDPAVVGHGMKVERMSMTFDELGFGDIDERTESRIIGPLGVPPILIGTRIGLARSTYSNYRQARTAFWEDTAIPEFMLSEKEYQYYLRQDDAFVSYDMSSIPALVERTLEKVDAFKNLFDSGYPRDMAANIVGLPAPPSPGGQISWMPLNLIPAGGGAHQETGGEEGAVTATDDDRKFWASRAKDARSKQGWTVEQKRRIWQKVDRIATSWEPRFEDAVAKRMKEDLRHLLAIINHEKSRALRDKQTINWSAVEMNWDQWYNQFGKDEWRDAFAPLIEGVMLDQGESWSAELGIQWSVRNLQAERWFSTYVMQFAQPILDTTTNDLHTLISQALENGWSIPEMSKQIELTFERYLDPNFTLDGRGLTEDERKWFTDRLPRYRRELIARTETLRASNTGSHNLFKSWSVPMKEWLATFDGRARDSHEAAGAAYAEGGSRGPIPIDQPFVVGGYRMMHPHDSSMGAPLSEIANCRCTELPYNPAWF